MFVPFFCPTNIYRPSPGKVQFGRPNPTPLQQLNFYFRRKKKPFHSELHALHRWIAWFSIFIPVNIFHYIYIYYNYNYYFFNILSTRCCEVFADVSAIYFTALQWIMNVWSGFGTLKSRLLAKPILIIFLLCKWIKYIFVLFVLKRCLKLGILLWNELELLYSLCQEIVARPPGAPFF